MSELLKNRKHRQEMLKGIIRDLHDGVDSEEIKGRFGTLLDQVGAAEIADIEQSLINEGLPVAEIQKLCDVHVAVFKESLDKQKATIDAKTEQVGVAGCALTNLKNQNKTLTQLVGNIKEVLKTISEAPIDYEIDSLLTDWKAMHDQLHLIDQHYSKKENVLFPYLERYGISGPPSVMWGTHDEIRASYKEITQILDQLSENVIYSTLKMQIGNIILPTLNAISEMIYKEENILFPLCLETFTEEEWEEIKIQLDNPLATVSKSIEKGRLDLSGINLDIGKLTAEQINLILTHLPIDITFVDEKDEVAYFSLGPERHFERTRAIIGRKVQFCHPPASMDIVEQILDDFKSGRKDTADFWINMKGIMIYIRYFAVRDREGTYKGTLEVTQNITEIQKLSGERRIYSYNE